MPICKLTEYSYYYAKTSGRLWQYCRNETNDKITDFETFKF